MPQIYPKASTAGAAAAESSPRFPEIEELVLKYWKQDGTFQASIDAREPAKTAGTSASSTTARPSPTACRTTATC